MIPPTTTPPPAPSPSRSAEVYRRTGETEVRVSLCLDGAQADAGVQIDSKVPFFDHLLAAMARHGRLGLRLSVRGDLATGSHHTVEDAGLAFGEALRITTSGPGPAAIGNAARGVARFGHAVVPMDDALVLAAIDLSGRPFFAADGLAGRPDAEGFSPSLWLEFCRGLAAAGHLCLHLRVLAGEDGHHVLEAAAKAMGVAIRQACRIDPTEGASEPVSTKGPVHLEVR